MELNRNHYFMIGIVFLLLGMQLRTIKSYVLNGSASAFVNEKMNVVSQSPSDDLTAITDVATPAAPKTLKPRKWLGCAFISVGVVFVLHSLAMKRPG